MLKWDIYYLPISEALVMFWNILEKIIRVMCQLIIFNLWFKYFPTEIADSEEYYN